MTKNAFAEYPLGAFEDDPEYLRKLTKEEIIKLVVWLQRRALTMKRRKRA